MISQIASIFSILEVYMIIITDRLGNLANFMTWFFKLNKYLGKSQNEKKDKQINWDGWREVQGAPF